MSYHEQLEEQRRQEAERQRREQEAQKAFLELVSKEEKSIPSEAVSGKDVLKSAGGGNKRSKLRDILDYIGLAAAGFANDGGRTAAFVRESLLNDRYARGQVDPRTGGLFRNTREYQGYLQEQERARAEVGFERERLALEEDRRKAALAEAELKQASGGMEGYEVRLSRPNLSDTEYGQATREDVIAKRLADEAEFKRITGAETHGTQQFYVDQKKREQVSEIAKFNPAAARERARDLGFDEETIETILSGVDAARVDQGQDEMNKFLDEAIRPEALTRALAGGATDPAEIRRRGLGFQREIDADEGRKSGAGSGFTEDEIDAGRQLAQGSPEWQEAEAVGDVLKLHKLTLEGARTWKQSTDGMKAETLGQELASKREQIESAQAGQTPGDVNRLMVERARIRGQLKQVLEKSASGATEDNADFEAFVEASEGLEPKGAFSDGGFQFQGADIHSINRTMGEDAPGRQALTEQAPSPGLPAVEGQPDTRALDPGVSFSTLIGADKKVQSAIQAEEMKNDAQRLEARARKFIAAGVPENRMPPEVRAFIEAVRNPDQAIGSLQRQ